MLSCSDHVMQETEHTDTASQTVFAVLTLARYLLALQ